MLLGGLESSRNAIACNTKVATSVHGQCRFEKAFSSFGPAEQQVESFNGELNAARAADMINCFLIVQHAASLTSSSNDQE